MSNKNAKLGLGIIIGTVIGAVAGMLLSPGSGEENRKKLAVRLKKLKKMMDEGELEGYLRDKYGDVSQEGVKLYKQAREELIKRIDEVKDDIDQEKYDELVTRVVDSMKREAKVSADKLMQLRDRLQEEWTDAEQEEEKPKKKQTKKAKS